MADLRIEKMARVLVDYSTAVQPGDRVLIEGSPLSEPLVRAIYRRVLERGGQPQAIFMLPDEDEIVYAAAGDEMLDVTPWLAQYAIENTDVVIRPRSTWNTRALNNVPPARQALRQKALSPLLRASMQRAAEGKLRWMSTQFPTPALAMEAEMGWNEYQDFFYAACHVDENTPDPVAHWQSIQALQDGYVRGFKNGNRVELRGPNVDLNLSVRGRTFINASGQHNLPDGEIYTGPVEDSLEGWVRFTYPAIYQGRAVEGVELRFERGQVVQASSKTNQEFLLQMLATDAGAKYAGEFAVGTNFQIDRFTRNILFDEKLGGTIHIALGASYPDTGGQNRSMIHWDMICDMRQGSEIRVDGVVVVRDGKLVG
jgi:aminopeptidase